MVQARTERRKRRSQEELHALILQAARETFKQQGFGGATTAAIAARAEVTEAQLFRYFPSKAALYREAVFTPLNEHLTRFMARQAGDFEKTDTLRDKARDYTVELQDFLDEQGKMLLSLLVAQAYAPSQSPGVDEIAGLEAYFDRGAALHAGRLDSPSPIDPRLMVRVSFAAVLGCVLFKDWLIPETLADDETVREAITAFVLDGVLENPAPQPKP